MKTGQIIEKLYSEHNISLKMASEKLNIDLVDLICLLDNETIPKNTIIKLCSLIPNVDVKKIYSFNKPSKKYFYTINELSSLYGIGRNKLRKIVTNYFNKGNTSVVKNGKKFLINKEKFDKIIQQENLFN